MFGNTLISTAQSSIMKLTTISISKFNKSVKQLGSSLSLPAHGWVGARATLLFLAAHFAKQNTNSVGVQSEGEAEGGCGGNSASPEPKRSPAALLVKSRAQQKRFLFLLPPR